METTVKKLEYNEQVKIEGWMYSSVVRVFSVEGYDREYKKTAEQIQESLDRCAKNNWPLAITTAEGEILTADYAGKSDDMAKKAKAYENATILTDGETVEIEGRKYTVKVINKEWVKNSDPIHFIPVK